MNSLIKILAAFPLCFLLGMTLAPPTIAFAKRIKAEQTILHYVTAHSGKAGTPTFGGVILLASSIPVNMLLVRDGQSLSFFLSYVLLSYGIIGFLDDYIKVKGHQNQGLKAYQKIIAQCGIAIIVAVYCYRSGYVGDEIIIPFSHYTIALKWWYIPFAVFVILAGTNAVNLTDGLDGLAGKTSLVFLLGMLIIIVAYVLQAGYMGQTLLCKEYIGLGVFVSALCGGLLAFLWHNSTPASVFMGDTGSLALGSAVCCVPLFLRSPLLLLIGGAVFVLSCVSVVVQVIAFKSRGRRVYLMAPYHHHLELKGLRESKIVSYYTIITAVLTSLCVISALCSIR